MKTKQKSYYSFCVALFLFQYSLLIPVMRYISPTLVVGVSGVLILTMLFIAKCRDQLSLPVVCLILVHGLLVSSRVLLGDSISLMVYGLMIPLPALALFLFDGDLTDWLDKAIVLAFASFAINCWIPFSGHYEYMRFGYGMILSTVVGIIYAYNRWLDLPVSGRVFVGVMIVFSGMESLLYGPRGSVIVVSLCVLQLMFLVSKALSWRNVAALVIGTIAFYRISDLIDVLSHFANRIGVNSYSISKFRMQLEKGIEAASSGREEIYSRTIQQIADSPLWGHRIDSIGESGEYVHNLFLQVGLDWGMLGLIVLAAALFLIFSTVANRNVPVHERLLLVALSSTSIGRLLFSSTYWLRPEFWMMIGFLLWIRNKHLSSHADYKQGYLPMSHRRAHNDGRSEQVFDEVGNQTI